MTIDPAILDKIERLDELAMGYETAVIPLGPGDYLTHFYNLYEIQDRSAQLVDSPNAFRDALRELSGYDRWEPIADMTEALFGQPHRIAIFDNDTALRDELEGPDGLAPFFFVFDLMFCEYEDVTLCFMSGTNN